MSLLSLSLNGEFPRKIQLKKKFGQPWWSSSLERYAMASEVRSSNPVLGNNLFSTMNDRMDSRFILASTQSTEPTRGNNQYCVDWCKLTNYLPSLFTGHCVK